MIQRQHDYDGSTPSSTTPRTYCQRTTAVLRHVRLRTARSSAFRVRPEFAQPHDPSFFVYSGSLELAVLHGVAPGESTNEYIYAGAKGLPRTAVSMVLLVADELDAERPNSSNAKEAVLVERATDKSASTIASNCRFAGIVHLFIKLGA